MARRASGNRRYRANCRHNLVSANPVAGCGKTILAAHRARANAVVGVAPPGQHSPVLWRGYLVVEMQFPAKRRTIGLDIIEKTAATAALN